MNTSILSAPAPGATLPAARTDMRGITAAAARLEAFVATEPSLPVSAVQAVPADELVERLNRSTQALLALTDYCSELRRFGARSAERLLMTAGELMPVALLHVVNRFGEGTQDNVTPQEQLLLEMFSRTHGDTVDIPEWFSTPRRFIDLQGRMDGLPGPEAYIRASEKLAPLHAGACEKLELAHMELERMRSSPKNDEGPDGDATVKLRSQINRMEEQLLEVLRAAPPVDPKFVKACAQSVEVGCEISPAALQAVIALHNDLGKIVTILTKAAEPPARGLVVEAPELTGGGDGEIARIRFDAAPLIAEGGETRLAQVLTMYAQIRTVLVSLRQSWARRSDAQTTQRAAGVEIERCLDAVFPGGQDVSSRAVMTIAASEHAGVQEAAARILTAKVKLPGGGAGRIGTVLELSENVQILARVVHILVRGGAAEVQVIREALDQGPLRALSELALRARKLYELKNPVAVAKLFDQELKDVGAAQSYIKCVGILLVMLAVSEDSKLSKQTRGFLKELERITEIAGQITMTCGKLSGGAARFVENTRAVLAKRLSVDLSDYLGQTRIVQKFANQLRESMLLARHPEAWEGLPPNKVIYNGYLLVGKPGSGKSHLVKCLANELGIPLVRVTGEELFRTLAAAPAETTPGGEGGAKAPDTLRSGLAELVKSRVQKAEKEREKSGAPLTFFFLDELEALFLDRRNLGTDAQRVADVNAMLTAIEELIAEEPGIIFVGATNYLHMVDEAGTRRGRFGLIVVLEETTAEDVKIIVKDCLDFQGIQEDLAGPEYEALFKTGAGLNVLPLQQAIHRACCLKRARALEEKSLSGAVSVTAAELLGAVQETRQFERSEVMKTRPKLSKNGGETTGADGRLDARPPLS